MAAETPLLVEIVAYAPTAFYHCTHCEVAWRSAGVSNKIHEEQVGSSLPPDIAQDYQVISDWVRDIFRVHCDRVVVKVIDAASIEGFWKTLQHGIRRYPAVVIEGQKYYKDALQAATDKVSSAAGKVEI